MSMIDKSLRLLVAAIWFFVFGFICPSWWWVIGLVPLLTGYYGYCPLYSLLGKCKNGGSCKAKEEKNGK